MPGSNSSPGSESPHSHSHSPPLPQSAPSPPQELSHLPSPSPVSPLRSPPRSPSCQHPELSQLPRFLSPTPSPSPSPPQTFRNLLFDHISGIHDMCEMARSGEISDITGRDKEIRRVIEIMCRKTKNSVVLIGEPGVGKTAIAEGLAHRIVTGEVPEDLRGSIYAVDVNELSFGSGLREIISAAIESQSQGHPAIIFIDELHVLLARGDAANLLKPALARGQLRLLGATTLSEYREHIETDAALERRFSTVIVNEPSPEQTIAILRGLRAHYEGHHNVRIMDEALETAVDFSRKYLAARRLPDSAIDLLDEACAAAKLLRFMKPDKVYDIEQEISNLSKRIESLEKDSHLEYEILVQKAKNRRSELKLALNDLQQQHEGLKSWWRDIDTHRKSVKDYKEELDKATNESGTTTERLLEQTQTFKESQRVLHELERRPIEYDSRLVGIPDLVTPATVAEVIERATKIPIGRLMASDKERLLKLEDALNAKVIGQPEAVKAVARAIKISRMGLANIDKPIATLLFTGSSGTGKTLLAKTLAEELFGHSSAMIRFDGSEYTSDTETTRLIGSAPGYADHSKGGKLTEYVRRTPYCIILLDEIEKAGRAFRNLFIQVLGEGRLTSGLGHLVDFRNTIIIMTSNIGTDIALGVTSHSTNEENDADGKSKNTPVGNTSDRVIQQFVKAKFPVEFLNRVDELVIFRPATTPEAMNAILDVHLRDCHLREGMRRLNIKYEQAARKWLLRSGMSPQFGARHLVRTIQREVLVPISERLLNGDIEEDSSLLVKLTPTRTGLDFVLLEAE